MPPKNLDPSGSLPKVLKQYVLAEVKQTTANSALGCEEMLGGNLVLVYFLSHGFPK